MRDNLDAFTHSHLMSWLPKRYRPDEIDAAYDRIAGFIAIVDLEIGDQSWPEIDDLSLRYEETRI